MHTNTTSAAALALLAAMLTGCASGRGGPQTTIAGGEGFPMTELDAGHSLGRDLEIRNLVQTRKSDFLVAQFELHNLRGSRIELEWSADWFDASGLRIDTNASWRPLVIGGRGYESLQITAPTPDARSWKLKVQKPNPVR